MLFFSFIFTILSFTPLTTAILDDDILYDIKWHPESNSLIEPKNDFIITSKRKEKYSCVLPTFQTTDKKSTESILLSEIEPLIKKLYSKKLCTYRFDPYWTYELCHGKHIRQYHESKVDDKITTVQEYFLGYHHSDNQDIITNTDNQQILKIHYKTINNQIIPMLPVRYSEGTLCDINSNKPRETIVFYVCHERGNNGIVSFQEISSCQYEMTIATSWMCDLPEFRPEELNRHAINCFSQDNAPQKPRNLKRLESEHESSLTTGEGGQFTMTSADGTTLVVTYRYANEDEVKDLTNTINSDLTNEATTSNPVINDQQLSTKAIVEFLEGFFSGRNCLTGGSGWWQYEVCYGKHVIQFHEEQNKRTEILLGTWNYQKHVEWINTNPKKKSDDKTVERQYASLYYGNGDQCELAKKPRVVEVKLRCSTRNNKSHVPTMYLVEPESCSYVLGIESPVFCNIIDYTDENGIPDVEKVMKHFEES
ncbi:unnamed protein product [Rotaria magnacalcarata]